MATDEMINDLIDLLETLRDYPSIVQGVLTPQAHHQAIIELSKLGAKAASITTEEELVALADQMQEVLDKTGITAALVNQEVDAEKAKNQRGLTIAAISISSQQASRQKFVQQKILTISNTVPNVVKALEDNLPNPSSN
jgi:hypothetical protein